MYAGSNMSESSHDVPAEILGHYGEGVEESRLLQGASRLEFARTREVIERFLPPPPASVLDVGGAVGMYARWLTDLGYEVHLVDPVPFHVEQARTGNPPISATLGDARRLEVADGSVTIVVFLGPLYHLTERADRIQALREAWRVLKPGGLIFAAAISRFASLIDGLRFNFIDDPRFRAIMERDLREGQHRNPTDRVEWFTTAFFHLPDELRDEIEEAGFELADLVGLEGLGWMMPDLDERWVDPARRKSLLHAARLIEHEPRMLAVSAHLLAVGRRPEASPR
jgi:SAM-dependent methyltransferase